MTIDVLLGSYSQFLAAMIATITVLGFFVKWLDRRRTDDIKKIDDQRADDIKIHDGTHALQDARFSAVEQKAAGHEISIAGLHTATRDNDLRLVRIEAAIEGFKDGQKRIENSQEAIKVELKSNFTELAKSIREIRTVAHKPE